MLFKLFLLLVSCSGLLSADKHCRKWPKNMTKCGWANETVCFGDANHTIVVCNGYNRDATLDDLVNMPMSVKQLYIYGFNLNLTADIFPENNTLEKLYICSTVINNLTIDAFKTLTYLKKLEIQQAPMTGEQHITLFQALANISLPWNINLTLTEISLTEETLGNFSYISTSIYKLNIDGNVIDSFDLSVFAGIPNLTILEARDNGIKHIIGSEVLPNLTSFDVSNNSISEDSFNFCNARSQTSVFPKLTNLTLTRNRIAVINTDTMGCLTTIKSLKMGYNILHKLNVSNITGMVSLTELNLRGNWLQYVFPDHYPVSLSKIDMSRNEFSPFLPQMCNGSTMNSIKELNLDYNPITKMTNNFTACLTELEILTLHKTSIIELKNNSFSHFPALQRLDLSHMTRGLQHIAPAAFNSSTLKYLDLSSNYIKLYADDMKLIFLFTPAIKNLTLSYNFIREMNASGLCEIVSPLEHLEHLIMKHIGLQQFPLEILNTSMKLISLNVDDNIIRDFEKPFDASALYNTSISYISAAKNRLTFHYRPIFPDDVMRSLKLLNIQENEFGCDCYDDGIYWFREQIKETGGKGYIGHVELEGWPDNYKCYSPKGTLFRDFNRHIKRCQSRDPYIDMYIITGCVTFVMTVLFVVCFWNRWYIQYYWHNFKKRSSSVSERDTLEQSERQPLLSVKYDGYVLCDSQGLDKHAVTRVINLFENELHYRLHYEHRDGGLGDSAMQLTFEAMDESKNIVVIVTENLMRDNYCGFLVDIACQSGKKSKRKWNVIFIVMSDINLESVSKSWCVWLTRYTSAPWTEETDSIQRRLLETKISLVLGDPLPHNFIRQRCANRQQLR